MDLGSTFFGDNNIKSYATNGSGFGRLISSILPTFYIVAGFILFVYLVFGGFLIISSSGDEKKTAEGQQALTNAIIGFVVIFTSYWIIQIVEVVSGITIF